MAEKLPSESLDLPNSPSSAENRLIAFGAFPEFRQQIETTGGFCLNNLAETFPHRRRLKDLGNEAEGNFERTELLDQARIFGGRSRTITESRVD